MEGFDFKTQLFINGEWCDPVRGGKFTTYNPATGEAIIEVANATEEDVNIAVAAAKACLYSPDWGYNSTGSQRATILRKLAEILTERKDALARLDVLDQGKPLREALADIGDSISACEHFAFLADEQDRKQNEVIDNGTNGDFVTTISLEPIGVIGGITPWNYPFLMGIWKVVASIAAGCTMVLKPSELAPLSCLLLAEMCFEAGLPAGALNVLTGLGPDAGGPLSAHDDIDKLSFTGSCPTGRRIMAAAAQGPRSVTMELGGKSPLVVFEDADIPSAVDWIMTGILWGSGQVCSATSRVLVHTSIREKLLSLLIEKFAAVRIGNSLDAEMLAHSESGAPTMGPVVSADQCRRIWTAIDEAKAAGLHVAYGGDRETVAALGPGYFVAPTIFVDVPVSSFVWTEEIFGPVLCIREFETEEEAVFECNNSIYGLAAAVFSADTARCDRVAKNMRAGIVWKNCCQPAFIQAPWGGVKKSGFGRELGRWGLEEYTSVKQVTSCAAGFDWGLWK